MQTLLQDIRYGLRMMAKRPWPSVVAILALAIGIGANTAIFSLVDGLILRPLPFNNLDQLVMVWTKRADESRIHVSPADYADWKAQQTVFKSFVAYRWWEVNLTGTNIPERVQGYRVSADFFQTLDVHAIRGRVFLPEDAQTGGERIAIINESLWKRRFAEDPNMVGQSIMLDGQAYTVIGIMSVEHEWPMTAEIWTPMALSSADLGDRVGERLFVMGRLKPEIGLAQAQAEMGLIAERLAQEYPDTNLGREVSMFRLPGQRSDDISRPFLLMLMGAVGFVLLIACANVANLQIARTTDRNRELAIREAMGASQWRIRRQLLIETLILSISGALLGLVFALWGIDVIKNTIPADNARYIPGLKYVDLDLLSLGFTFGIACLTGVISGLAPALRASKDDLNQTLKESGRGTTTGTGRRRLRGILVVGEVALALILLVGTGVMVNGFEQQLQNQRQGFNPDDILAMRLSLPASRYPESQQQSAFYDQTLQKIQALPMVESVSLASYLPSTGDWVNGVFEIEDQATLTPDQNPRADFVVAGDTYFNTMQIPLTRGRGFTEQDNALSNPVVVVSESVVQRFWPDSNPIGRRIRWRGSDEWRTVIGVVGNVKTFMFDSTPRAMLYVPYRQSSRRTVSLVIRTTADPQLMVAAVRTQIKQMDTDLPIYDISSMQSVIDEHIAGLRLSATLIGIFGVMALILAAVGVYSVMSYAVSQRTHEIGVRMAIGARPADVLKLVVKQGMGVVLIGVGIGLIASFMLIQTLESVMYGVLSTDPVTVAGIGMLLTLVALVANIIPARRAAKVNPIITLRYE